MNKHIARVAVVATASASVLLGFASAANAVAGTVTTQQNGSAGPVYLYKDASTLETSSQEFAWNDNLNASGSKTTVDESLVCPSTTTVAYPFVASTTSGASPSLTNTLDFTKWTARGSNARGALTNGSYPVSQATVNPSGMPVGAPNSVKVADSYWNIGVACVNANNGNEVVKAFFRTIHVLSTAGNFTVAATDYVYPTPTLTGLTGNSGANPNVGDTLTANLATVPDGFTPSYQWKVAGSNVGTNSATYTVVDNDNDKNITVTVTYARSTFTDVVKTSAATLKVVGGTTKVSGDVGLSVTTLQAVDGTLTLDVPTGTVGSFGSSTLQGDVNTSKATGTLSNNVTVNDARVYSRKGWELTATVSSFSGAGTTIDAKQLGIAPKLVASGTTAEGQVIPDARVAGTALGAGSSYLFASATAGNTVGATKLNADLTFVAPQYKPAGTYTGTLSLTLASKP